MRGVAACSAAALLAALSGPLAAAEGTGRAVEIALPRAPAAGERVWLRLTVGPLGRGAALQVTGVDGTLLGSLAPVGGAVSAQGPPTYVVPLPADAVVGGRIAVRLVVREPGGATRAPTPDEVPGIEALVVPAD